MKEYRLWILLILTAALFLLIGRCSSTAKVDQSNPVRASDIVLAEGEVLVDLANVVEHTVTFHEDPACHNASGRQLVKVPYDSFRQAHLAPCAYCCRKYNYK